MINTQYINLNMIPSGVMPVLYCSQYDVGRPLGVVVYNGAESVDLSGYTCTIEATRTDKTPVTAGVTTSGNIGVFETTATMTNQADTYKGKLVLTDGNGKRVASLAFVLVVTVRTMDEDAEEIEEDASLYQQYTGTVQTIIASIRADLAAEITARQNAISTEASTRAAAVSAEAAARQSADNTLQSNINAEASTRATQDASLQSQIDQLIAPSGEAPSAAEVENARIGSDGTVYPTLGDAIRTQNSLLKSHLGDIVSNNVLYERVSATVTGTRYAYVDIFTLTSVDVTKQYTLHVDNVTGAISPDYTYIRFLDSSDNLLSQRGSGTAVPVNLTVNVPTGTAKIVFRLYASANDPLQGAAVYSGIKVYEGTSIVTVLNDDIKYSRLDEDEAEIESLKDVDAEQKNLSFAMELENVYSPLVFQSGALAEDHDSIVANATRAVTGYVRVKDGYAVRANTAILSDGVWIIFKYDLNKTYTGAYGLASVADSYLIDFDGYIRIQIGKSGNPDLTSDNIRTATENVTVLSIGAQNIAEYAEQLGDIISGSDAIPSYWVDEFNADVAKLQVLDAQVGANGDSFVFVTDTHIESNEMVSPRLISAILKRTSVDKVVHGGDIYTSSYTKSGAIAKMYTWFAQMYSARKYYQVRGNHEINDSIDGVSSDEYLTDSEYYGVCVKRSADYIVNPDCHPYYYFDNEVQKIRYFVLDTGSRTTTDVYTYFTAQLAWMENLIDALDDSWGIVVLLHIMFTPKQYTDASALLPSDRGSLLISKLDSLYGRTGKPQIICVISGHVHRDFSMVSSAGYPIIATAADTGTEIATDGDPVNRDRTPGTTNEQLFDVCHINKTTRTISMTRIGAGADRSFTY